MTLARATRLVRLTALVACLAACGAEPRRGNVLVVLLDDVGPELLACYGASGPRPATPTIDALASDGVAFETAWASPLCSPSRALLMTGRYGFRTGVGSVVTPLSEALPLEELTLPEAVERGRPDGVATAAFGKWHLGNLRVGGNASPNHAGWGHFAGTLGNLVGGDTYHRYTAVVNGRAEPRTGYATSDTVDDALDWIAGEDGPWLAYVAFHAAHASFHAPPAELVTHPVGPSADPERDLRPYFLAMVEALDTELGRLLEGLGDARDETTVILLADNGTTPHVIADDEEAQRVKGSLFEGGLRVPLLVSGPGVVEPGRRSDALVGAVDVYATVCGLLGFDARDVQDDGVVLDSRSFLPLLSNPEATGGREALYAEVFTPNGTQPTEGSRTVRGARFKLVESLDGAERALFDLATDPEEQRDLLGKAALGPEASLALERLAAELERLAR